MALPGLNIDRRNVWLYALSLLAGAVGAVFGYDFGTQIGGGITAWIAALCCALFSTLVAASLIDTVARWVSPRRPRE
jgi:4-amino-4-deoxy-L-arabinose transferase-like glycosyltransferase